MGGYWGGKRVTEMGELCDFWASQELLKSLIQKNIKN